MARREGEIDGDYAVGTDTYGDVLDELREMGYADADEFTAETGVRADELVGKAWVYFGLEEKGRVHILGDSREV